MPPRRRSVSESLTSDDLTALATALADGKRATVYMREATPSLGLAAGASARVISIDGTTVTVKPSGVDDELPYEADELRITKAAPPAPEKPKKAAPARKAAPKPAPAPTPAPAPAPAKKAAPAAKPAPAAPTTEPASPVAKKPAQKPAAKVVRRTGAKKPPASVTVTLFGSSDNEWSVAVTRGGRKPARSRTVAPDSVESALSELGDGTAFDAAASVLNAAREEAQRRVEELSRELQAARDALAALEGSAD
ncbi:DUF6319 family protein [Gordonia sp. (in: high G+C Gram-positive bacteria)]|uniref:DUF6319 family protein n=1 Tax=Gordonia sp. (in: high G+C Gram-positive bacteria) TaxID=84139 RepID=UPI00169003E3|nr:DUF6319 family protein [Gordonia sp. (in: high G+C Gram-positive bacteria)]NLG45106.1 hypothetical protein [Gordonia sp. (in: high G+C Gram-positive bacteria)]